MTEAQIVFALRQAETGVTVAEICRKMGISEATLYNWKRKFGGLGTTGLRRLREFEAENQQLKKLVADLSLDKHILAAVERRRRGDPKKALRPAKRRELARQPDRSLPCLGATCQRGLAAVSLDLALPAQATFG